MIRVSVMYAGKDGGTFNFDYYSKKHMALVGQRLASFGLLRTEVDKGLGGGAPGQAAPYVCTGHLYWNSLDDFQKGMKAHGQELMGDVPNFTNLTPQMQISEILS
jgi:uncharacterized protein (TIGR02118 family)